MTEASRKINLISHSNEGLNIWITGHAAFATWFYFDLLFVCLANSVYFS